MQDAIDLSTVTIHNAPADIASWPVTRAITRVQLRNDSAPEELRGFSFLFEPELPDAWKWPSNPQVPSENYQYTVWVVVRVGDTWHASGFIQMWQGRKATGAPVEEHWDDWAYDANRWGGMVGVRPAPGMVIGLFVSAGNARGQGGVTSVRERSNVVAIQLPANDQGDFVFSGSTPAPIPTPTPAPHPTPAPPAPPDWLLAFTAAVNGLRADVQANTKAQLVNTTAINALNTRLDKLLGVGLALHQ